MFINSCDIPVLARPLQKKKTNHIQLNASVHRDVQRKKPFIVWPPIQWARRTAAIANLCAKILTFLPFVLHCLCASVCVFTIDVTVCVSMIIIIMVFFIDFNVGPFFYIPFIKAFLLLLSKHFNYCLNFLRCVIFCRLTSFVVENIRLLLLLLLMVLL